MNNFTFHTPTIIHFGKGCLGTLGPVIKKYASRILLVYGQGSIKANGTFQQVTASLKKEGIIYKELSDVAPNPRISSVRNGIALCREHKLELVLAVGGGSSIDCAKVIAAGVTYKGDPWDFFKGTIPEKNPLPVAAVLTLAATGSEANGGAVITNMETREKLPFIDARLKPVESFLDPALSCTVPARHTAAGIADIMSHILEQYFSPETETFVQNRLAEGLLKTCIKYGPIAVQEPDNYEARAQLMWTSTLALNGLLSTGKSGDWANHSMEHELSAFFDIPHGIGLAILTPHWMDHILNEETAARMAEYAENIWGITDGDDMLKAKKAIIQTRYFFLSLGIPETLKELDVTPDLFETMADRLTVDGPIGNFVKLSREDILAILQQSYHPDSP